VNARPIFPVPLHFRREQTLETVCLTWLRPHMKPDAKTGDDRRVPFPMAPMLQHDLAGADFLYLEGERDSPPEPRHWPYSEVQLQAL